MPHARHLLAGNWKMNLDYDAGIALAREVAAGSPPVPLVLCTPAVHVRGVADVVAHNPRVAVGGQDLSQHTSGAHTGEVSGEQLRSAGATYVVVGHSERRADHGEAGGLLREKVSRALDAGLRPIYCFGETLDQRQAGEAEGVVSDQLAEGIADLDAAQLADVVLAYEPVWAIGTGETATPQQAQAIHAHVRDWVRGRFGDERAGAITILYGGSVKPANAAELFAQPDIDGGLVGGASLRAADFLAIAAGFGER